MTDDAATGANADQIAYWNEVAGAKWAANQSRLDRLMAPLGEALVAGAAARPGDRVLDVGCGCGDIALRLAAQVGPTGQVTGVDVSQPMLTHAEGRQRALPVTGRAPMAWVRADAMTRPFDATRDLMVSRFGVMFFDDRPRAFANLRGALAPGGRFAFLTWRRRREVEWMHAPLEWLASLEPVPDDPPGEVGPFALADAEASRRMLREAGFASVTATPVDAALTVGEGSTDDAAIDDAYVLLAGTGPAAAFLNGGEPELRARAEPLLRAGLRGHLKDGAVTMGGACWLYQGTA